MDETGKLVERLRKYGGNRAMPGYYGGYAPSKLYHEAADTIERLERLRVAFQSDELVEAVARAIYELEPHEEGGEYVDGFQVSPGGKLTWEQAKVRDAEFGDDPCMLRITDPAYKSTGAALDAIQKFGAGETR